MADFVTTAGLEIKTVETILSELAARQRADIDVNLNTAADSPMGQVNGIFAAQLREAWEVLGVAYNGFNPDAVEGFLQDKLSALTGTLRRAATKSTVVLSCNLDMGTTLLASTHFANVSGEPDNRWTPEEDYTAPGAGAQDVDFEAEIAGAEQANAGTLTVISTPVVGWNSCTNALDADIGREVDTNAILRQRREEELRASGSATVDAIRADLLQYEVDGELLIEQAGVFENVTGLVDENGLPPRSFECVVFDGSTPALSPDEIAQAIWDTKPAGILSYGQLSGTATDSLGRQHVIGFSRPTELAIYVEIFPKIDSSTGYAGAAALKDALVDLNISDLLVGRDVIAERLEAVSMGLAGVFDKTSPVQLGFAPAPVGTVNLVIGIRGLARLDTSRITVTETFATVP